VHNWYEILGVPEDISPSELKVKLRKEEKKHHPDRHEQESQEVKDRHEARFKMYEEGVSFLLNKASRDKLDEHLRAAERAAQAAAEAEATRKRNEEEAQRRGDADDLRERFGSPPPPAGRTRSGRTGLPPQAGPSPPTAPTERQRAPTNPIFSLIEGIYDLITGVVFALILGIGALAAAVGTGLLALAAGALALFAIGVLCVGALWACVELLMLLVTGHFAPG
jgi:hypothetical protein